jgi:3-oxoacyl-[acyl-carrier protein] reductase
VRSLATQYGPHNITINNVAPGYTATDRIKSLARTSADATGRPSAEYETELAKGVPMGRLAKPEEIADAIVWLASERAAYITGQTILVDGGVYRGL